MKFPPLTQFYFLQVFIKYFSKQKEIAKPEGRQDSIFQGQWKLIQKSGSKEMLKDTNPSYSLTKVRKYRKY